MKLKSTTIALLLSALACGIGVFLWTTSQENTETSQEQQDRALQQNIFDFSEDQVTNLTVITPKLTLVFKRTQQSFPQTWRMVEPQATPADEAAIAFLLNQLATSKSPQPLSVQQTRRQEFGFDSSPGSIKVVLADSQKHHLILGGQDPTESFLYAQVNPVLKPTASMQVFLVPTAFLGAINRPLKEWQAQPPQPTPTASPSIDPGPSVPLPPPQVPQ